MACATVIWVEAEVTIEGFDKKERLFGANPGAGELLQHPPVRQISAPFAQRTTNAGSSDIQLPGCDRYRSDTLPSCRCTPGMLEPYVDL